MKRQTIRIPDYGWTVHVYYNTTPYDRKELVRVIKKFGGSVESQRGVYDNMSHWHPNNAFTYSNGMLRVSVMSLGWASSFAQFINSFSHELHHLSVHIAQHNNLPFDGEEIAYLAGDMAQMMYPILIEYLI